MTIRRHRFRRIAKWMGTLSCTLILAAWTLSVPLIPLTPLALSYDQPPIWTVLQYGNISGYVKEREDPARGDIHGWELTRHPKTLNWPWWFRYGLLAPSIGYDVKGHYWEGDCPLWLPFLTIAAPTAFLWHRDRRGRSKPGHCGNCNYNLSGNTTGICPECGDSIANLGENA